MESLTAGSPCRAACSHALLTRPQAGSPAQWPNDGSVGASRESPARATALTSGQPTPPSCTEPSPKLQCTCSYPTSICDLQERFRPAIHEFPKVVATTQKVLKASRILNIPVFATTQNKARLGETCPELGLDAPGGIETLVHADKTLFSMLTPEVRQGITSLNARLSCVIVGIESHICVTQTALDLLDEGHKVYVLADGVSSCNKEEIPIAFARLRHEGVIVTTSESWLYECIGDAGIPEFKQIISVVKETGPATKEALQTLCKI